MRSIDILLPLLLASAVPTAAPLLWVEPLPSTGSPVAAGPLQAGSVTGIVRIGDEPTADVVVYLEAEETSREAPPAPERTPPVIDQTHLEFLPDVAVVRPGMSVDFLNSDGILHNVFSPGWSGEEFDLGTYPSGATRSHTFTEPGPHVILCKVHPEMVAYVVVVDTPYFAVSDSAGRFSIGAVSPGRYRLTVWRRGGEERRTDLVVPPNGMTGLTVDVSDPGRLLSIRTP